MHFGLPLSSSIRFPFSLLPFVSDESSVTQILTYATSDDENENESRKGIAFSIAAKFPYYVSRRVPLVWRQECSSTTTVR